MHNVSQEATAHLWASRGTLLRICRADGAARFAGDGAGGRFGNSWPGYVPRRLPAKNAGLRSSRLLAFNK
jgi:hypothetical protein